jgi:hypothetical protein
MLGPGLHLTVAHIWRLKRGHAGLLNQFEWWCLLRFFRKSFDRRALRDPIYSFSQFFSVAGKSNSMLRLRPPEIARETLFLFLYARTSLSYQNPEQLVRVVSFSMLGIAYIL